MITFLGPILQQPSVLERCFCFKEMVCIFGLLPDSLKETFYFNVKLILMWITQSSMPIELHVRVSLATVHTVKDGEGKECLSRSATWYLCQPASLVKWSHELQSKCLKKRCLWWVLLHDWVSEKETSLQLQTSVCCYQ